jgi:uncharacterized LabA/DUF88 family protein
MTESKTVGIFIDYENVHISLEKKNLEFDPIKLETFRILAKQYGQHRRTTPVARWDGFIVHQNAFIEFGIQPLAVSGNAKNASDIALTVECMKSFYTESIDAYVIFAGDGGFIPLVNHLLNEGKEVYLYSVKGATSEKLLRLGDKHYWIEEQLHASLRPATVLNPKYIQVVKVVYNALYVRKMPFLSRRQLFNFIKTQGASQFGTLSDEEIGKLLDETIDFKLIYTEDQEHPDGGKPTRSVRINFDNPRVQMINLR